MKIEKFLLCLESNDIEDWAVPAKENSDIYSLLEVLKDFESASQTLEKADTTMWNVSVLFSAGLESLSIFEERLSPTAPIITDKVFKYAVVKIQLGKGARLSAAKSCSVRHLLRTPHQQSDIVNANFFCEKKL